MPLKRKSNHLKKPIFPLLCLEHNIPESKASGNVSLYCGTMKMLANADVPYKITDSNGNYWSDTLVLELFLHVF